MSLTADRIFTLLDTASFGAYAVTQDQTILFWNQEAERILGFTSGSAVGRRCYDVVQGVTPEGGLADCRQGCSAIDLATSGQFPPASTMRILCASGEAKEVSFTTMAVGGVLDGNALVVHLFAELSDGGAQSDATPDGSASAAPQPVAQQPAARTTRLTNREVEVLRLVAQGWDTPRIARDLNISPHTVLNHIRHFRRKLGAPTKLDAVVSAIRLGILPIE